MSVAATNPTQAVRVNIHPVRPVKMSITVVKINHVVEEVNVIKLKDYVNVVLVLVDLRVKPFVHRNVMVMVFVFLVLLDLRCVTANQVFVVLGVN